MKSRHLEKAGPENNYHYNKALNHLARQNRKNMTKSAAVVWKYVLGHKQMLGFQFRRERPILNYIVDFVCLEILLIIEVDGFTHDTEEAEKYDEERDRILQSIGFTVLRFSSWETLHRITDVSSSIVKWINENTNVEPSGKRKRKRSEN